MYSNVDDMTKWIRFLLDEGRVADDTLVSRASFDELFQPQTIIRPGQSYPTESRTRPHFVAYGLGWFLQDYRGHKIAFHTGSIDGTVAIVGLLPALELGVVVFANRDHVEVRHALMLQVFDRFIGAPVRDWNAELTVLYDSLAAESRSTMDRLRESRIEGTEPRLALDAYAGDYRDSLYGRVTVSVEDGHLVLRASDYLTADLQHFQFDTFEARWRHRWLGSDPVTFAFGGGGTVTGLRIGEEGGERYRRVEREDK
jgi:CubicO group peptidase (beta-lactamase class C family)